MKTIYLSFLAAICLLVGCGPKELTRDEATELLSKQYPTPLNFKVPIVEEEFLIRAASSNLEEEGWITIERQSFLTTSKAIRFTDKSKPYLLPMSRVDMEWHLNPVKLADTEFIEVTGIVLKDDGRAADVEYTIRRINKTPFIQLFPEMPKIMKENERFTLYDDGWRIKEEEKP